MIRISPIRLIDQEGRQVGVVETPEALRMAREAGLDLVEVQPDVRPPVCKITDYGKYKYDLSKRESKGKAAAKGQELKEVRLGRSIKVDPHDIAIRVERARKFLLQGHKVLLVQQFRGREMMHRRLGEEIIRNVVEQLDGLGKPDGAPRVAGRRMSLLLNPDRARVEAYRRKLEQEKAAASAKSEQDEPQEAAPAAPQTTDEPPAEVSGPSVDGQAAAPSADASEPVAAAPQPEE